MNPITKTRIDEIKQYISNPHNPDIVGACHGLEDWVLQSLVEEKLIDLNLDIVEPLLRRERHDNS